MAKTKIEWADETWNPVTGCTPVSEGCYNCYAKRMSRRLAGRYGYPGRPDEFKVTIHEDKLDAPLKWRKPRMVFVCSMGDLFHEDVPREIIKCVYGVTLDCPQHIFQILTKRPERMREFSRDLGGWAPNVWLGVTAENQRRYDERIIYLFSIQAAVRFVSFEPLLEEINPHFPLCEPDWLIVGGETGPRARDMKPDWARLLRDQAKAAGIPFFMKQMSYKAPIPPDLLVREYPEAK